MCETMSRELYVSKDGKLKNNFEKDTDVVGVIFENNVFIYRVKYAERKTGEPKKPKRGGT